MNLWQRTYAEQSTPLARATRNPMPFAVTRGARGGLHGWDTETVTCNTREEADALADSALSLPRTIDVRVDDWTSGKPVAVRKSKPKKKAG